MARKRPIVLLILSMSVVLAASSACWPQGFGEPSPAFGQSESERQFAPPGMLNEGANGAVDAATGYFRHDQLLKLVLVLAFSFAGLAMLWTRRVVLRRWILVASVAVLGFVVGGVLCPISAVQNVVLKAATGYLLLFLAPTVTALFAGRLFCGYVCPFGALQELLHIRKWKLRLPVRWMQVARLAPYVVLAVLVARVLAVRSLTWDGFTPFKAFFTLGGTPATLAVSALFVAISVVVFRPFCRLVCPLGAWLSLVSRLAPFRVRVDASCVACTRCDSHCPSGAIAAGKVRAQDCLLCGECLSACPADALHVCRKEPTQASENST